MYISAVKLTVNEELQFNSILYLTLSLSAHRFSNE